MEERPEQGSGGFTWRKIVPPVKLPPSPPISERWFSRRRVGIASAFLLGLILITRAGSCGPPPPAPGSVSVEQVEAFARLNAFHPGPDLVPTGELMAKAQNWTAKMARDGHISHSTLSDGIGPGWRLLGENVAVAGSLAAVQAALEASPGHRANMENPTFTEGGVGVVIVGSQVYVTQSFLGR